MYYWQAQDEVRRKLRIQHSAATLLDMWEDLIGECAEGYGGYYIQLDEELMARDHLQAILDDASLTTFPEHRVLRDAVRARDDRFKQLLQPNIALTKQSQWWRRGVLRRARAPYVDYMRDFEGVSIELVP